MVVEKQLGLRGACAFDGVMDDILSPVADEFVALDGRQDERVAERVLGEFLDSRRKRDRFRARTFRRTVQGRVADESSDGDSPFGRGGFDAFPVGFGEADRSRGAFIAGQRSGRYPCIDGRCVRNVTHSR